MPVKLIFSKITYLLFHCQIAFLNNDSCMANN